MNKKTLFQLYEKERAYQTEVFGDFNNIPKLNIASFLQFMEEYLEKSKKGYTGCWTDNLPEWLNECSESVDGQRAPIKTYDYLIKVFVLAGAALEVYTDVDVSKWRDDGIKRKWLEDIK